MFALHKTKAVAVFYDQRDGMMIPVSVDLSTGVFDVAMPPADELAEDYIAYATLAQLKRAVHGGEKAVDRAARFSRHYSRLLGATATDRSLRDVRELIREHYERNHDAVDFAVGNTPDQGIRMAHAEEGEHAVTA